MLTKGRMDSITPGDETVTSVEETRLHAVALEIFGYEGLGRAIGKMSGMSPSDRIVFMDNIIERARDEASLLGLDQPLRPGKGGIAGPIDPAGIPF